MHTTVDQGVLVVTVESPRLDVVQAEVFRKQMTDLTAEHQGSVVLDLVNVRFMDSSGLSAVIAASRMVPNAGQLCLAAPQAGVASLLRLTRLDRVLRIYSSSLEAVQALAA